MAIIATQLGPSLDEGRELSGPGGPLLDRRRLETPLIFLAGGQGTLRGPRPNLRSAGVASRKPNGNRYEPFSYPRRREIKVPSPPTREGRGEGKACA